MTRLQTEQKRVVRPRARVKAPKFFVISTIARPAAGKRLFAHTHAALLFSGLLHGKAAPHDMMVRIVGPNTMGYHEEEGRIRVSDDGRSVRLTAAGKEFFLDRAEQKKLDPALIDAFVELFSTGRALPLTQVRQEHVTAG